MDLLWAVYMTLDKKLNYSVPLFYSVKQDNKFL